MGRLQEQAAQERRAGVLPAFPATGTKVMMAHAASNPRRSCPLAATARARLPVAGVVGVVAPLAHPGQVEQAGRFGSLVVDMRDGQNHPAAGRGVRLAIDGPAPLTAALRAVHPNEPAAPTPNPKGIELRSPVGWALGAPFGGVQGRGRRLAVGRMALAPETYLASFWPFRPPLRPKTNIGLGPILGGRSGERSVDVEGVAPGRAATLPPLREAEVRARWELLIYARAYDLGH